MVVGFRSSSSEVSIMLVEVLSSVRLLALLVLVVVGFGVSSSEVFMMLVGVLVLSSVRLLAVLVGWGGFKGCCFCVVVVVVTRCASLWHPQS